VFGDINNVVTIFGALAEVGFMEGTDLGLLLTVMNVD
jgi:hypothetical protein